MQLSVFLTPILSEQLRVGYGVCEELAVFSQDIQQSQQQSRQHIKAGLVQPSALPSQSDHAMSMANMSDMSMMSMPQAEVHSTKISEHKADSQAPPHQQSSSSTVSTHDLHHALCNFCFLFGHSVLPPAHHITFVLVAILVTVYAVQIDAIRFLFFKQNKNLRPQGRAPPQFIL